MIYVHPSQDLKSAIGIRTKPVRDGYTNWVIPFGLALCLLIAGCSMAMEPKDIKQVVYEFNVEELA